MSNVAFLVTGDNVTISRDGKTLMVNKQYADFKGVLDLLKARKFDEAFELSDRAVSVAKKSNGVFQVKAGVVYRDGVPVHNVITDRILAFQEQGLPFEPLVRFLENLLKNPSERSIKELYKFLENRYLPITEDGCFLAYKAVQKDYLSVTSGHGQNDVEVSTDGGKTWGKYGGKVPNYVGSIVRMDRKHVNDDANQTCSFGLHAGALEYAKDFYSGGRMIIIKINPMDAVSVPNDANAQKLRVSKYEVIAEYEKPITKPAVKAKESARPSISVPESAMIKPNMILTLQSKKTAFTEADVKKIAGIIEAASRKHLKIRNKLDWTGKRKYSKMGYEAILKDKDLTLKLKFVFDTRYKQPDPNLFTAAWQKGLATKYDLSLALLK